LKKAKKSQTIKNLNLKEFSKKTNILTKNIKTKTVLLNFEEESKTSPRKILSKNPY